MTRITSTIACALLLIAGSACSSETDAALAMERQSLLGTGAVEATWQMSLDGTVVPCHTPGVEVQTVTVSAAGSVGTFTRNFNCAAGVGLVAELPVGTYDVTLIAKGSTGAVRAEHTFHGVQVLENATTPLTNQAVDWIVAFASPGARAFFALDFGAGGGSNCASLASGGEEVLRQEIAVVSLGTDQCELHTFVAETPVGDVAGTSYCPANVPGSDGIACVESGVQQYIDGLAPGEYELTLSGIVLAGDDELECYVATTTFAIGTTDVDLTTLLVPVMTTQGC